MEFKITLNDYRIGEKHFYDVIVKSDKQETVFHCDSQNAAIRLQEAIEDNALSFEGYLTVTA